MSDTQISIFMFCGLIVGCYFLMKQKKQAGTTVIPPTSYQPPPPPPPTHPLEHLIRETYNFSHIKFDGITISHNVYNSAEATVAIKELRFFRKLLNADKKQISDQLRTIRANVASIKGITSIPSRSGLVKGARFGIRAITSATTLPLENQKSMYNSLLLQCDRVQIDLERF